FLRQDAQLAMDFAAAYAKRRYDGEHRDIEFEVGDKVFLRLHHGYHLPGKPPRKLSQQRSGPFVIKRRVGRLAYELDLPDNMNIHPVISVAQLAPAPSGDDPFGRVVPPPGPVEDSQSDRSDTDSEPGESYEVEIVLQHKLVRNKYKYLIKWKGWGHEHNVWKDARELRHAQKLVDQYWARQGGQPSIDTAVDDNAPRRHGRPRKNQPPTDNSTNSATVLKNAVSANSLENAVSAKTAELQQVVSSAPEDPAPVPIRPRGRPRKSTTLASPTPDPSATCAPRRSKRLA
ncbi:hypothetical protein C8A03DRAFT_39772, partial [Achaetomium macrosporum]